MGSPFFLFQRKRKGNSMRSIIIIFAAIMMTIATPFMFIAIDDAITEDATQSFAGISTAAGVYAANVTLSRSIYDNDTQSIDSIASNITADTPSAYTWNSVSKILTVSGLSDDALRTLTIGFKIDSNSMPDGAALFWVLMRWFWIFAILGYTCGAVYAFFD